MMPGLQHLGEPEDEGRLARPADGEIAHANDMEGGCSLRRTPLSYKKLRTRTTDENSSESGMTASQPTEPRRP